MPLNVRPEYKIYSNLLRKPIGTAVHLGSGSQPNASHEYRSQIQPNPTVSFYALPRQRFQQRTVWWTGRMTQVPQIAGTNYYFIRETTDVTHRSSFVPPDAESVVSSGPVCAAMWPIRLLCNDGLRCSQYSGLGKSNYGHCVCAAWLPCSSCHLSTVNYLLLCDRDESERDGEKRDNVKKTRIQETNLMAGLILICKLLKGSFTQKWKLKKNKESAHCEIL